MTGTSARLPIGTAVKGFVDEDVQLAIAAANPEPLVVGGAAAPIAVPAPVSVPAAAPTAGAASTPAAAPAPATK
ncbi:hypothetical protein [Sphingomonas cavernae]|uniref:hypothetical protein n=1 Tax=Sphingomonas cavernae TaxID=2320861 RepID=UPI001C725467|nr:hypothetical protein [Sphingomonas cavernae]